MKTKNKNSNRILFAAALLSSALISEVDAVVIAEYDYMPASGTSLAPSAVFFAASATNLTLTNPANTAIAFGNHFYHNNWSPTIDLGKYYETTIANIDDGHFKINCMSFSMESTSGTSNWFLRSSDDNFSSNIANGSFSDGLVTDFINVDTSSLNTLNTGDSVTLRWYVTAQSTGAAAGFANHHPGAQGGGAPDVGIDLSLHTECVPEPSSALLLGLGGMAIVLRRKRIS